MGFVAFLRKQKKDFYPRYLADNFKVFSLLLLFLYCAVAPLDVYRYVLSGYNVPGVEWRQNRVNWQIPTIKKISREIDAFNIYKKPVICSWPGYLIGSSSPILPGLENHLGITAASNVDQV